MGFLSKLLGSSRSAPTGPFPGVDYSVPPQWSAEIIDDDSSVLLMAPEEEVDWQANILIELREDPENRSIPDALADLVPNLQEHKPGFAHIASGVERNTNGVEIGRIVYSADSEGTPLTEWELIIPLPEGDRLFIVTSSATAVWPKYKPLMEAFVNSIAIKAHNA